MPDTEIRRWASSLRNDIDSAFQPERNGHLPDWRSALTRIPSPPAAARPRLNTPVVGDGADDPQNPDLWMRFHPWRKGPYRFGEIDIDTEWRSDLKWERLRPAIAPLAGRRCLDVGCGNGYHLWRMLGEGASLALGLDPFLLYVMQFLAVAKRLPDHPIAVLPLPADAITKNLERFDTTFSMGVLYHAKTPEDHLLRLRHSLRSGGELVLETLTVEEAHGPIFRPEGRYARMRKIHAIPTVDTLADWLQNAGFSDIRHVDTTATTSDEQRSTEWMTFHSLPEFLDPQDSTKTVEGYPAPRRSILTARKPEPTR